MAYHFFLDYVYMYYNYYISTTAGSTGVLSLVLVRGRFASRKGNLDFRIDVIDLIASKF